ncbi:MAG: YkgJ family cysteine cluster protein [Pirellulaceae bacterium]|nr:YkgJ family cysteine cluster protein [Pirellulaceae bacterium]
MPLQVLPTVERWDCHQCGICCRGSIVPLSDEDLARLREQHWERHPEMAGTPTTARLSLLSGQQRLAQHPDGRCVFLLPDGMCRIHRELGFGAKPLVCRMFPLQIVPRDSLALLTIRRACPSAAADRGQTVAEQLPFAKDMDRQFGITRQGVQPPPLKPGETRDWKGARLLLETYERQLTDERYPPVRRIVHALVLSQLFERAKTKSFSHAQLGDLLRMLETSAPDEVGTLFSQRERPAGSARVLFRQTAAEVVRLHPRFPPKPTWGEWLRIAWGAIAFARGRGPLPKLHLDFPPATFEQLEEPLGPLDPAIYLPLNRFLETTALSWNYALSCRGRWSLVESLRQLAITYPIALWLLRWASCGRQPTVADMIDIVVALDRSQGYAPLAGSKQRRRLALLASLDELTRLDVWYAR